MGIRLLVVCVVLVGCSQPEVSSVGGEHLSGEDFFMECCASCHGVDGKAGLSGAGDLSKSALTDEEIRAIIKNGKNAMPPFKAQIEEGETLDEVIEFVKSLKE